MKNITLSCLMLILTTMLTSAQAQSRMTEEQKQEARERYEAYKTQVKPDSRPAGKGKSHKHRIFRRA